jgi:hypothetical protein
MADPCAAELATANSCVSGDPATCSCFTQPFLESFPNEVSSAYRKTMAFEVPGTPEFCDRANFNVCIQFDTTASCCCGQEITEYTKCAYTNTLNVQFGAPGCEHTCGTDGEEGGGGTMIIIIIIIMLLLGCGAGGFFYYRRRTRLAALADEGDIESGARKKVNVKGRKKDKDGVVADSDSDSTCSSDKKQKDKRGKLTKKSSKKGFDSESESDNSGFSGRGKKKTDKRGKLTKRSSKKGFDSDSDDSEYSSKKKGKLGKRNSKNNHSDSDSESSEDSPRNNKKSKKKKGDSRRGHSDSDSESSGSEDEFHSKHSKKSSKATQKGSNWKENVNEWDSSDSEHTKEEEKKRRKGTEASVRQARTILTSYSTTKDQDISSQVQAAMKTEMSDVLATMKAQREVMEERLQEAERAAMKLRYEQEYSRKQITDLETKKQEAENSLQQTQQEAKLVRSNSYLQLAEKEGEKIIVSAELEGVRKERENMSKMIKNLEQAKQDMEGRLTRAKEEATTLKAQNEESTKRVTEVEKDRETMKLKLAQLQKTRSTIEARLKDAEEEGKQLKEERKEKSKQIKSCDNDDDIHQYQSQKNAISKDIKKIETEREEMTTMLARVDKSCDNVKTKDTSSWLAKDILNRSQHGLEGGDRSRDSRRFPPGSDHARGMGSTAGRLGNEISNMSFNDMSFAGDREHDAPRVMDPPTKAPKQKRSKDPSVYSRRDHADDQSHLSGESASLQMMREKHRASEKRLKNAISKGKPALNGAQLSLVDEALRVSGSTVR